MKTNDTQNNAQHLERAPGSAAHCRQHPAHPCVCWWGGTVSQRSVNSEESELKGTGTAEDPYQIGSAAALAEFRDKVNDGERDADAVLIANIDLSEICSEEKDTSWTPIGNAQTVSGNTYKGTFDGQGHAH